MAGWGRSANFNIDDTSKLELWDALDDKGTEDWSLEWEILIALKINSRTVPTKRIEAIGHMKSITPPSLRSAISPSFRDSVNQGESSHVAE